MDGLLRAKQTTAPRLLRRGVPRWLTDAVARGLQPLPERRHADLQSMLAVLSRRVLPSSVVTIVYQPFGVVVGGSRLDSVVPAMNPLSMSSTFAMGLAWSTIDTSTCPALVHSMPTVSG